LHASRQHWASDPARAAARLAAAALFFLCADGCAQDSLCRPGEPVVFSCHVGRKTVSLCRPSGLRQELIYRFGTPGKVELTHPGPGRLAAAPFARASAPLAGGGVTSVVFQRGAYQYSIYSKMTRGAGPERAPEFEDGILIARAGKPVRKLVCDDGGEGFRESLDWLPQAARP